ncbi:MAG: CoA transferase [Microbacterium sp.]
MIPPDSAAALAHWACSGAMRITGDVSPDPTPANAFAAFTEELASTTRRLGVPASAGLSDPGVLLAGRAALSGRRRAGRTSLNGATRMLRTPQGWWALSLARPSDRELLPALLEQDDVPEDPWPLLETEALRCGDALADRAGLMGMPAALLGSAPARPIGVARREEPAPRGVRGALVVDFSALWAGPLAGALLAAAGATVVKVEWADRPDGARGGAPAFYDWLNAGKLSLAIRTDDDRRLLARLLDAADVVLESSRPRALPALGFGFDRVARRPGRVWVRITGHGADAAHAHRTGFGDDAACAGGLVGRSDRVPASPVFAADAIADPLTGVRVATEIARSLDRGGGELLDVSLSGVAAAYAIAPRVSARVERRDDDWIVFVDGAPVPVVRPRPPVPVRKASALGADGAAVARLVERADAA